MIQSTSNPNAGTASGKKKDAEPEPEITPLVKMLQNAGPIRNDGTDKFFGLENVSCLWLYTAYLLTLINSLGIHGMRMVFPLNPSNKSIVIAIR